MRVKITFRRDKPEAKQAKTQQEAFVWETVEMDGKSPLYERGRGGRRERGACVRESEAGSKNEEIVWERAGRAARKRRLLARNRLARKEALVWRVFEVVGTRETLEVCKRGYWRESGIRRKRCGRGVGKERGTCVRKEKAGGTCVRDGEAVGENEVGKKRRSPSQKRALRARELRRARGESARVGARKEAMVLGGVVGENETLAVKTRSTVGEVICEKVALVVIRVIRVIGVIRVIRVNRVIRMIRIRVTRMGELEDAR
jgi:hypothetical protein